MSLLYPILFVDLLKQSSYKNAIFLSMMHKQMTYFSKKYSKSNRIVLNEVNKLFITYKKDNIKMIKCISKHRELNMINYLLFRNAAHNNTKIVRWFLRNGCCIQSGNFNGSTKITFLAYFDNVRVIKILLDWKVIQKNENNDALFSFISEDDIFIYGAKSGNIDIVRLLLDRGMDINARENKLALCYAATKGHTKIVALLLKKGIDVHYDDDEALGTCVYEGHMDIMKLLLAAGANVHVNNDDIIRFVDYKASVDMVQILLDKGVNVHVRNDEALRSCARYGRFEIVKLLLENGADVHAQNEQALKNSVSYGHLNIVKILLDYGADMSAINNSVYVHPNVRKYVEEKLKLI